MEDALDFIQATAENRQRVLDFLCEHFLLEETMNVALRLRKEDFLAFVSDVVDECLSSGYSVLAVEKESGAIAGLILNTIWRRNDNHFNANIRSEHPNSMEIIEIFLTTFADAFWRLVPPNVDAVLHREILSVGSQWQRRGIASRLIEEGYDQKELKEKKIGGFASKTSSLANQMLMKKKGYEELMSIPFSSVLGVDGIPLVRPLDGTTKNVLYWKPLL